MVISQERAVRVPHTVINEQYWPATSGRRPVESGSDCRTNHRTSTTRRGGGSSRQQRPSDYQSVWSGCSAGLQSNASRGIDIATRRSWESRARATYCHQ
jgi:hypothetical protein